MFSGFIGQFGSSFGGLPCIVTLSCFMIFVCAACLLVCFVWRGMGSGFPEKLHFRTMMVNRIGGPCGRDCSAPKSSTHCGGSFACLGAVSSQCTRMESGMHMASALREWAEPDAYGSIALDKGECLADAFRNAFAAYAERPCLGLRREDGEFVWVSYAAFEQESRALGRELQRLLPPGTHVGIVGHNCYEWFLADFACLWAGFPSVPLSEAWDSGIMEAVLHQADVAACCCTPAELPKVLGVAARVPRLTLTVLLEASAAAPALGPEAALSAPDGPRQYSLAGLLANAAAAGGAPATRRAGDALHTILHTSGTTGIPKGVMYCDRLWLTNMVTYPGTSTVGFSYMPLAFITDRHTVYRALWNGGRVGMRTPGARDTTDQLFPDLLAVQPTLLKGVPSFREHVHEASRMVQDRQLRILGGRAALLCCGAGALRTEVAQYFAACTTAAGAPLTFLEAYGGTECGNLASDRALRPHVQWRLLSPETGWPLPDLQGPGAVQTGAMMFSGYYKDPERTAAAFTEDGVYRTGDVVRVTLPGPGDPAVRVEVVGRAKTSIKLANGKWVQPEPPEDLYRAVPGVRLIFVHGDSGHDLLVAVVDPSTDVPAADAAAWEARLVLRLRARGRGCCRARAVLTGGRDPERHRKAGAPRAVPALWRGPGGAAAGAEAVRTAGAPRRRTILRGARGDVPGGGAHRGAVCDNGGPAQPCGHYAPGGGHCVGSVTDREGERGGQPRVGLRAGRRTAGPGCQGRRRGPSPLHRHALRLEGCVRCVLRQPEGRARGGCHGAQCGWRGHWRFCHRGHGVCRPVRPG